MGQRCHRRVRFFFFRCDHVEIERSPPSLLYTSIPKYEELSGTEKQLYHNDKERYNAAARKGTKTLYFARLVLHLHEASPIIICVAGLALMEKHGFH